MAYETLFTPTTLGSLTIPNRVIMAPLTRSRTPDSVPGKMQEAYYGQRAGAGLIISEATNISPTARGYVYTPGIWTDEQEAGWKGVVNAVHAKGGRIALQLWHVGRISEIQHALGRHGLRNGMGYREAANAGIKNPNGRVRGQAWP